MVKRPSLIQKTGAFDDIATHKNEEKSTTRDGKKAVPFWIPVGAKKQLDYLCIDLDVTQQTILTEALNDLFVKYNKPPIA